MSIDLSGRVALVTGAGSGIGREISLALAGEGIRVGLNGRKAGDLNQVADEIMKRGGKTSVFPADVRSREQTERLVRDLVQHFGGLDVLVNNAGAAKFLSLEDTSENDWDEMIGTNLKGPFLLTKFALPHLKAARGIVVNVGSVAGVRGFPDCSAYCASKSGLRGLARALRAELAGDGVRVVTVTAGATDTPLWDKVGSGFDRDRMIRASDVAAAVVAACRSSAGVNVTEIFVEPIGGDL